MPASSVTREFWLLVVGGTVGLSPGCTPARPVRHPEPPTVECSLASSETYSGNGCDEHRTWRVLPGGRVRSQRNTPGLEEGHTRCGDIEVHYRWRNQRVWCTDDCPDHSSWEETVRTVVTRHGGLNQEWLERAFVCVGGRIYLHDSDFERETYYERPLVPLEHKDGKLRKGAPDDAQVPAMLDATERINGVNWYVSHRGLYVIEEQLPLRFRLVVDKNKGNLEAGLLSSDGTRLCMSQRCGLACIPIAGGHWEPTYLSIALCAQERPSP